MYGWEDHKFCVWCTEPQLCNNVTSRVHSTTLLGTKQDMGGRSRTGGDETIRWRTIRQRPTITTTTTATTTTTTPDYHNDNSDDDNSDDDNDINVDVHGLMNWNRLPQQDTPGCCRVDHE